MPRITDINQALEKYSGGNNDFFTLADDKETAKIRFLIGDELRKDEDWFIVHESQIGDKKRWVMCTEESDCPLCRIGNRPQVKLFLQLIDYRDGQVKTWERGRKIVPTLQGLISKYGPLYTRCYEVERHGKKGSSDTTYQFYPLERDDAKWEELPQKQNLLGEKIPGSDWARQGGFILVLSHSDMKLVAEGKFDPERARVQTQPRNNRADVGERF